MISLKPKWVDVHYSDHSGTAAQNATRFYLAENGKYSLDEGAAPFGGTFSVKDFTSGARIPVKWDTECLPRKVDSGLQTWNLMVNGTYYNYATNKNLNPFELYEIVDLVEFVTSPLSKKVPVKVEKRVTEAFLVNGEVVSRDELEKLFWELDELLW